jgi:flavodoxin
MKTGKKLRAVIAIIAAAAMVLTACGSSTGSGSGSSGSDAGKVLVVYFSASGNTRAVAEEIADDLDADTFEITPKDKYTDEDLDWTNEDSRVNKEHNDESLQDIELESTEVDGWDSYDTVFLGYPIWWGDAAWPVNGFVKANDFSGKKVIPFCTSASSGIGDSADLLKDMTNGGNWQSGKRFSESPDMGDVDSWAESVAGN